MRAKIIRPATLPLALAVAGVICLSPCQAVAAAPAANDLPALYPNQCGPAVPGAGSPLLTYQTDASLPLTVYQQRLAFGPRITLRSAIPGELRYTLDGTRPTTRSRVYFRPFIHLRRTPIRIGIFSGTNLVTEAVAFPAHEMLAPPPDWRLPRWRRQSATSPVRPTLTVRDQAVLIEANRGVLRDGGINPTPPPPVAPESTASEIVIEIERVTVQQPGSTPIPLPPLNLTRPQEPPRIIAPPPVTGP